MRVERVRGRADRARFIDLPWKIYRDDPNWVPPLKASVRQLLDTSKHPFYDGGKAAEAELFVAWEGPDVVGRVAAIHNHRHNDVHQENVVFFGFFETIDRPDVARPDHPEAADTKGVLKVINRAGGEAFADHGGGADQHAVVRLQVLPGTVPVVAGDDHHVAGAGVAGATLGAVAALVAQPNVGIGHEHGRHARALQGLDHGAIDVRLHLGRNVAVKVMKPEVLDDPERRARVVKEAHIHACLEHAGIVRIYDLLQSDDHMFLVMRLIHGRSLHTVLREPDPVQRRVMDELTSRSDRLVVMSRKGSEILRDIYDVPDANDQAHYPERH